MDLNAIRGTAIVNGSERVMGTAMVNGSVQDHVQSDMMIGPTEDRPYMESDGITVLIYMNIS